MKQEKKLEEAKRLYKDANADQRYVLESLFPELAEIEDERIRKELIHYFTEGIEFLSLCSVSQEQILAWLEKQGEQKKSYDTRDSSMIDNKKSPYGEKRDFGYFSKPADKVEPKFHEGEWITNGDYTWKIVEVKPLDYILQSQDGNIVDDTISHVDKQFHSFTIQDAKDGDVLVCKGYVKNSNRIKYERICLFNNLDNAFFTLTKTSNHVEEYDIDVNIDYPDNTAPATKEQKEILFMTMKEAGYEWDAEKKELRKIEEDLTEFENALADVCRGWIGEELGWKDYIIKNSLPLLELAKEQFDKYEQKLASWSEEDV